MVAEGAIDIKSVENFVGEHNVSVVDCWAPWCGPCKTMLPVIDELAREMNIAVGKINIDENHTITSSYMVMSVPTLLIFKNGELVDRITGTKPKNEIKRKIETYI
jgi:thioredoxin